MGEELYTILDISKFNNCDRSTVAKHRKKAGITGIPAGNKTMLYTPEMIIKMGYKVPDSTSYQRPSLKFKKIISGKKKEKPLEVTWTSYQIIFRNGISKQQLYTRQIRYKVNPIREQNHKLYTRQMILDMRYQVPGETDKYFVEDICEELGIKQTEVTQLLNSFRCEVHCEVRLSLSLGVHKNVRYLTENEYQYLKNLIAKNRDKKSEAKVSLEEMKKLHPLVTDDRFFKTSFFPDVVPECFKESSKNTTN